MASVAQLKAEADTDPVEVPLGDDTVRVLPVKKWKASAVRAIREGDFDTWAEKCLAGDDYTRVWQRIDPDLEQVEDFFTAVNEVTGQSPKGQLNSRR